MTSEESRRVAELKGCKKRKRPLEHLSELDVQIKKSEKKLKELRDAKTAIRRIGT